MSMVKQFVEKVSRGLVEMKAASWMTQQWLRASGLKSPPGWNISLIKRPATWEIAKGGLLAGGPEFSASVEPDMTTGRLKLWLWVGAGTEYYESQEIRKLVEEMLTRNGFRIQADRATIQGFKLSKAPPPRSDNPGDVTASFHAAAKEFDMVLVALERQARGTTQ